MQEERMKILEMVAAGKVTPAEGVKLLEALEGAGTVERLTGKKAPSLKVKVINLSSGKTEVNLNIPSGLVKMGLKMAEKFSPELKNTNLDWEEIHQMIQEGTEGKLVDVHDERNNKRIEVWLE
ncbi:MAG: SHOCT-like domain-containing protein [Bacillota bacterium]